MPGLNGETYLDNLQQAAQLLVDQGEAILVPSLRPTDAWQVVVGDRLSDPNWAAINVSKGSCLTTPPDQIATLSNLLVGNSTLTPGFTPDQLLYSVTVGRTVAECAICATTMSTRAWRLQISGETVPSGADYLLQLAPDATTAEMTVTAPDGHTTQAYQLVLVKLRA